MSTSLAEQLKKLTLPQTSLLDQGKKRASLLFDPKEAAEFNRSTVFEIGISGFEELKKLNPRFQIFQSTLFSESSKSFERSVQSQDVNKQLDKTIKKFLLLLSPYFLVKCSHKALEWLIYRFHIHTFNRNELLMLILPYHETNVFVRCLQLIDVKDPADHWHWLHSLRKPGIILPKSALINHCVSDPSFLQFMSDLVIASTKEHGSTANSLTTLYAFYCTTVIGTLDATDKVTEKQISHILPALFKGFSSEILDFIASSYMITAQLISKTILKENLLHNIVLKTTRNIQDKLRNEYLLLLVLLYQSQNVVLKTVPSNVVLKLATLKWFPEAIVNIVSTGGYVMPFLMALYSEILKLIQTTDHASSLKNLAETLLTTIKLDNRSAESLISISLNNFMPDINGNVSKVPKGNEQEYIQWYRDFLRRLEVQHTEVFNKVITSTMKEKTTSVKKRNVLKLVLNFAICNQNGDNLFEKLYHPNSEFRVEAVKYLVKHYIKLDEKDKEFFKEPLIQRFKDDNKNVIKYLLMLDGKVMLDLFNPNELIDVIYDILFKCRYDKLKWHGIADLALRVLCSDLIDGLELKKFFTVLPYLFPLENDQSDVNLALEIMNSSFGSKCSVINLSKNALSDVSKITSKEVCQAVYKSLFNNHSLYNKCEDILDHIANIPENRIDNTYKCLFAVVLTESLSNRVSPKISYMVLDKIFSFVITSKVINSCKINTPKHKNIQNQLQSTYKGYLPLECFIHCIHAIVENTDITIVKNSLLNFREPSDSTKLLVYLYEVLITGCSLEFENIVPFYVDALKLFFSTYFSSFKSTIEFLCNIILGRDEKENADKTVLSIDTELKIRTMKLINALLSQSSESLSWIVEFDSNICIPIIMTSLVSPFSQIRKAGLLILQTVQSSMSTRLKQNSYINLVNYLLKKQEEICMDNEQLPLVLYSVLSPDKMVQKSFKDKQLKMYFEETLTALMSVISRENYPIDFVSPVLRTISLVNSIDILKSLAPIAMRVMSQINITSENSVIYSDYHSNILFDIFCRINIDTLNTVDSESIIWNMLEMGLKQQNAVFLAGNKYITPSVFIMNLFDKQLFGSLNVSLRKKLLYILIEIGTESDNFEVMIGASKFIKHIDLDISLVLDLLIFMRDAKSSTSEVSINKRRLKRSSVAPSIDILNTKDWKRGITLLEYIQNKKKITNIHLLLPLLFQILKKCLDFMEQASLEYTKQLLLSCILNCCQKLPLKSLEKLPESVFDIESVVQCIRATQNPQTHHHALLVLAQTANIIPQQVLNQMMAIFTFMGSSVLRHDDAYSFQIITKVIDTVIPISLKITSTVCTNSETRDDSSEIKNVASVLRVFVDVMIDIPVHRRIPLFVKLLTTVDVKQHLWVFLALVFESHVMHAHEEKSKPVQDSKLLAGAEECSQRLEIANLLTFEFSPDIILSSCIKLLDYLKNLPVEKVANVQYTDSFSLFNINTHTPKQFRHFKYILICFLSTLLTHEQFVRLIAGLDEDKNKSMEPLYKSMILNILGYIQTVSKIADQNSDNPQGKYWKVMLHHCYEILDGVNLLLSSDMFLLVVKGLMEHNLSVVRRKVMELLNSRLQRQDSFFNDDNTENLLKLIDPLVDVVKTIKQNKETETFETEDEQNQQTALFSIKLLSKVLASKYPENFKPILELVTDIIKSKNIDGNVLASLVLCLAELCSSLRVHSLYSLNNFMPLLLKILKKQKNKDIPDLLTLSVCASLLKVVDTVPLFLNPYLERLLSEVSTLMVQWSDHSENQRITPTMQKLKALCDKIATMVPPRVLIPSISQCYIKLLNKGKYDSVGTLMDILAHCIKNVQGSDLKAILADLNNFFLSALQFRSDCTDESISLEKISIVEGHVVDALIVLVLKLSESSFRPLYYRLYDWAVRNSTNKDRIITFYRVSSCIADCLKRLFVLFAGHFISHAANVLDECNKIKKESLYFSNEEKCVLLIEYVMKTLLSVFSYDSQNFINKERFSALLHPLVDQLENTVGGMQSLAIRSKNLLTPCIAQFAVATADDALWKQLNYQILLKTRHSSSEIRLIGMKCVCAMANKLGENFLPLLPETIPFFAELMEDEDENTEIACKKAVQKLEKVLGEPLQKYF